MLLLNNMSMVQHGDYYLLTHDVHTEGPSDGHSASDIEFVDKPLKSNTSSRNNDVFMHWVRIGLISLLMRPLISRHC